MLKLRPLRTKWRPLRTKWRPLRNAGLRDPTSENRQGPIYPRGKRIEGCNLEAPLENANSRTFQVPGATPGSLATSHALPSSRLSSALMTFVLSTDDVFILA